MTPGIGMALGVERTEKQKIEDDVMTSD